MTAIILGTILLLVLCACARVWLDLSEKPSPVMRIITFDKGLKEFTNLNDALNELSTQMLLTGSAFYQFNDALRKTGLHEDASDD